MDTDYKDDLDKKQSTDEKHNPSGAGRDLYRQENEASDFEDFEKNYHAQTADDGQENDNIAKAKAKEDEAGGGWSTKYTGVANTKGKLDLRATIKKNGPLGALILLLGGGGIAIVGMLSPAMLLMQITDVFTNNFNDAHTTLSVRSRIAMAHKINNTRNTFAETSEGKCGVRCKSTTMSDAMARNLEAHKFKISPDSSNAKFDRRIVNSITFPDGKVALNGDQFNALMKDPTRASHFNKVFNSKTAYFLNSKFGSTLKTKLGINKAYKLVGESKEKFRESFRRAIGLSPAVTVDPNRNPTAEETLRERSPHLEKVATAINKLNGKPGNVVAAACFAYNTTRAANAAVKIAKYSAYAGFAMAFINAAHKLKAADGGGIDPVVVSELGTMLTATDPNKTLANGKLNELYGLSAMDSFGYKAAHYGDSGTVPEYAKKNSMESSGLLEALSAMTFFATTTPEARQVAQTTCRASDSPAAVFVQCAPTAPTIIGYVGCVGFNFTAGFIIGEAVTAVMPFMMQKVVEMNVSRLDENTTGALAGDALYPGMAAILGAQAISYGLKAGNKSEIKKYVALGNDVRAQDEAIAKLEAKETPFDVYNQYSFLGSMARSLNIASLTNSSLTQSASLITSTIPRSIASLSTNSNAGTYMPLSANKANQYGNPECKALQAIGAEGDSHCMPTFIRSEEELTAAIPANEDFMINNGYITEDGVPTGTDKGTEFQKYLDHCVFRVDPPGETSMPISAGDDGDYEWYTAANCGKDSVKAPNDVSNFRIYATDEPVIAETNKEATALRASPGSPGADTAPAPNTPGTGENSGNIATNGWAFPTVAGAPLTQGYHEGHLALDIASDPNNLDVPIYAMRDGTVMSVGDMPPPYIPACASRTGTTQQAVIIKHEIDGQVYFSAYHHVQSGKFPAPVGSTVKAGDRIATMGDTGCSTALHLHVELWKNSIYGGGSTVDLGAILYG